MAAKSSHLRPFLAAILFCVAVSLRADALVPKGYEFVTCGSSLKLEHVGTKYRLHSQDVAYGSGSGQHSVTIVADKQDLNDAWQIVGPFGKDCNRGSRVKCGATIRLRHVASRRWLHSHNFKSPLSQNQEVSSFGGDEQSDSGDNWKVECSSTYWRRSEPVRFLHVDTKYYLHSTGRHQYNRPIAGQREVCAVSSATSLSDWKTADGFYIKHMPKKSN